MSPLAIISYELYKKGKIELDDIKALHIKKEVEEYIKNLDNGE